MGRDRALKLIGALLSTVCWTALTGIIASGLDPSQNGTSWAFDGQSAISGPRSCKPLSDTALHGPVLQKVQKEQFKTGK